jgi:hypothetical protein
MMNEIMKNQTSRFRKSCFFLADIDPISGKFVEVPQENPDETKTVVTNEKMKPGARGCGDSEQW